MATIEQMQQASNLAANTYKQIAGQKAAQFAQNGDYQSAYSTMIAADPANADKYIQQASQINPELGQKLSQAQETGKQSALSQFGSTEGQTTAARVQGEKDVANIHANALIKSHQIMMNQGVTWKTGPDGRNYAYNKAAQLIGVQGPDGELVPAGQPSSPQPSAQMADSAGMSGTSSASKSINPTETFLRNLAPKDTKELGKTIDSLNKDPDMKDMNTELTGLTQAMDLARGNLPNSQVPLAMKFLTSSEFVKRFNEAEFSQGPTNAKAIVDKVRNAVSQGTTGSLDPKVMSDFQNIMDVMQHSTLNSYQGALQQRANGLVTKSNGRVKADDAMGALVGSSNPIFLEKAQKYTNLTSEQKAGVDWARKNLGDPNAMTILKHFGL